MKLFSILIFIGIFSLISNTIVAFGKDFIENTESKAVINEDAKRILLEQWLPVMAIITAILFVIGNAIRNYKNRKILNRK